MSTGVSTSVMDTSRRALDVGSKSFATAAKLLGPVERESATLMYAWCRYCDDVIDGQELGHAVTRASRVEPAERLAKLAVKTRSALMGVPTDEPAFAALQEVMRRHAIPHRYPMELIEGFAMDVENRRYPDLDAVLTYCYHVAGVVGLMMAYIMGTRDEDILDRACDLGVALQLTNIARDVLDDAALGRIYLPLEWLNAEHVPQSEIGSPRHRGAVARIVAGLLDVAEDYYRSADIGVRALPFRSAWSITVARGVYSDIGKLVRARGAAAWDRRAVVSKPRKVSWVVRGAGRALVARTLAQFLSEPPRPALWDRPRQWRPAFERFSEETVKEASVD